MSDDESSGADRGDSASDRVARSLREAIARGIFQAGERMYQDKIAIDLNVSRQPVRQAFQRLQAEGLLTATRPGRLVVTKVTPEEVIDNISLRLVLEPHAARLAAERITPEQIAQLRHYNRLIREDLPHKVNWNYEFHRLIAEASGSKLLAQFIDRLWSGVPQNPYSSALLSSTAQMSAQGHDAIIDCLARRDADQVEGLMREHISHTLDYHLRRSAKSATLEAPALKRSRTAA